MLSWIRSLGWPGIANEIGLKAPLLELLEKDFAPLDVKQEGISRALLRYAVDGDGPEVLQDLRGIKEAGSLLGLYCCSAPVHGVLKKGGFRADFFSALDQSVPDLLLRLAHIYDAAIPTEHRCLQASWLSPDLSWLEIFLTEATTVFEPGSPRRIRFSPHITAATIEAMFLANRQSPASLIDAAFRCEGRFSRYYSPPPMFISLPGFAEYVARHTARLDEILSDQDPSVRLYALKALEHSRIAVTPFIPRITQMAVSSSKRVREGAARLASADTAAALPAAKAIATTGSVDERLHAAGLISKLAGNSARPVLQALLSGEKSSKVRHEIQCLLSGSLDNDSVGVRPDAPVELQLPAPPPADLDQPLPGGFLARLETFAREYNSWLAACAARYPHSSKERDLTAEDVQLIFESLNSKNSDRIKKFEVTYGDNEPLWKLLRHQELGLVHAVRLLVIFGLIVPDRGEQYGFGYWTERALEHFYDARGRPADVREIAAAFTLTGIDNRLIGTHILNSNWWYSSSLLEVPPDNLWPYFAEHPELLEEALQIKPSSRMELSGFYEPDRLRNALRVFAIMPSIPPAFHHRLWEMALGTIKADRPLAQKCVEKIPGFQEKLILALTSGQQETRTIAAQWLGRARPADATSALVKALKKEKTDSAKAVMMQALEALGVPINEFMNRAGLEKEADKELARGVPDQLKWFPFESMPEVRWVDSGVPVSSVILSWFIVKSFKLKNPEPDPMLRRYCSLFGNLERRALGKMVLDTWIAHDTRTMDPDEAARKAKQYVARYGTLYQSIARQHPSFSFAYSPNSLYQEALSRFLKDGSCSAINEKGILAVAAACAGSEATTTVSQYLKQWYGYRAAQCKSLVQMIAWIDDPSAVQLLLSVGNRFRTKGIQEEAARQITLMADRKGWTIDELADRTIPTAGFDEDGVLELDYGSRKFHVRLGQEFKIIITSEAGKEVKSLPDVGKPEDEPKAKAAKAALAACRKELKNTLKLQSERLYEAMCVRRTWTFADWDTYLNRHPIVGRYCQSLVWGLYDGDCLIHTFRPLPDLTLTDSTDETVNLDPDASIRLAHACDVAEPEGHAWATHFADYKVAPLFAQFGRQPYSLEDSLKDSVEIADFQGYRVEAFKLRGTATRLGYVRGPTEDGGWFYCYLKNFVTLGLQALIEFSGNPMPEENRTVALTRLIFLASSAQGEMRARRPLRLHQIPSVLLSECYNDMRSIAAIGAGQDPDWEKKVQQ
jgi:hypothetical protein